MSESGIDLVVPWVDGSDPVWRAQRDRYLKCCEGTVGEKYSRDWGLTRYWFRGVEKNLPWIRKVHFVTWGHVPAWLNTDHPKLNIVRHEEFIPSKYLPTFSSIPIEINIHRIKDLSEQFIAANDDFFFIGEMHPNDYFRDGLPCDCLEIEPITEQCTHGFGHILWNNIACINRNFKLAECAEANQEKWFSEAYTKNIVDGNRESLRRICFSGFGQNHLPYGALKSVYEEVWQKEYSLLDATSSHKSRSIEDVSNWLMRYWQLASGRFVPYMQRGRATVNTGVVPEKIRDLILDANNRVICINESTDDVDFESRARYIRELFEMRLPEMSSFEKF